MFRLSSLPFLGLGVALAFTVALTPCARAQTTYTESILTSFTGTTGAAPSAEPAYGHMIQASDGNFYGTTSDGGADNDGTIFKITPGGVYTQLHSFTGTADGTNPAANLMQASDGNLYGMCYSGGASSLGTLYKITLGGTFTLIHSFIGGSGDGENPLSVLVQGTDGNFYGMTERGGSSNDGIVFKMLPTSPYTITVMHSFVSSDGANPYGGLLQGTDGNFYGTSYQGGLFNLGAVFKISPTSPYTLTLLHSFEGSDGQQVRSALVQGTDGNFYGTTVVGGAHSDGTVFKITSTGTFTLMHSFAGTADGSSIIGPLVEGTDGNFYGTAVGGGAEGHGTMFKISPTSPYALTVLHSFSSTPDGSSPFSGMVQGLDGNFYGATELGGADSDGTVFEFAVSPAFAAPVQLSAPASVTPGESFNLTYLVYNSYDGTDPGTMNRCFATNNAGDTTGWTGVFTGEPTSQTASLTATATVAGTYTYALTCGGSETGTASVTVTPNITFSSVTHNFGSEPVGTAAANYGVELTNSGTAAFPFAIDFTAANGFTEYNNCGSSVAAGKTCEILFEFTPTATGAVTANWSLTTQTGFAFSPANGGTLSGTGTSVGGVTLTTNGHNFGLVANGVQSPTYGTELVNSTSSTVTLTKGSVTAPFTSLTNCGTTLAAGQTCELEFYYTGTSSTSVVQQVYTLSASGVTITSGGSPLPNGGITLTGN